MNKFFSRIPAVRAAAVAALAAAGSSAFAVGPDFSTLSSAVDFTTVGTAILAIAAVMMLPKVIKWGAGKVLSMVRG